MEPKKDYIVQTTHQSRQQVTLHGKKAICRVRAGAKMPKMFRGQLDIFMDEVIYLRGLVDLLESELNKINRDRT